MRRGFLVCIGKYKLFRERRYAFNARTSATTESIVRLPVTEAVFIAPVYMVVPCRLSVLSVFRSFSVFAILIIAKNTIRGSSLGSPAKCAANDVLFPRMRIIHWNKKLGKNTCGSYKEESKDPNQHIVFHAFHGFPFLVVYNQGNRRVFVPLSMIESAKSSGTHVLIPEALRSGRGHMCGIKYGGAHFQTRMINLVIPVGCRIA